MVGLCVWHVCVGAHGGQMRKLDSLKLVFQVIVRH